MNGRYLSGISPEGKLLSQVIIGTGAQSSPTLGPDGTVYVATYDGKVIAYMGGRGGLMNSPWPKYQADLANSWNGAFLLTASWWPSRRRAISRGKLRSAILWRMNPRQPNLGEPGIARKDSRSKVGQ